MTFPNRTLRMIGKVAAVAGVGPQHLRRAVGTRRGEAMSRARRMLVPLLGAVAVWAICEALAGWADAQTEMLASGTDY